MKNLVVMLVLTFFTASSLVANCQRFLENRASAKAPDDIYKVMEAAEVKLLELEPYVSQTLGMGKEAGIHYARAQKYFTKIETELLENNQIITSNRIFDLNFEIEKTQFFVNLFLKRMSNHSFNALYDSPEAIVPDRIYKITNPDTSTLTGVSFSVDVVEDIFWSAQDIRKIVARQLLKLLIIDGFNRGLATHDIKKTIVDPSVLMLGVPPIKAVGAYRFLGYLDGTTLRIVTWSNDSNHGKSLKLFTQGFAAIKNDRKIFNSN